LKRYGIEIALDDRVLKVIAGSSRVAQTKREALRFRQTQMFDQ